MLLFIPRSLCALKRVAAKAEHSRFGATMGIRIAGLRGCTGRRRPMAAAPSLCKGWRQRRTHPGLASRKRPTTPAKSSSFPGTWSGAARSTLLPWPWCKLSRKLWRISRSVGGSASWAWGKCGTLRVREIEDRLRALYRNR
jgi:hypothetical protein